MLVRILAMKVDSPRRSLMVSSLQHYAYCPRQFALIHNEQAWAENKFTAEGKSLHERVDSGVTEQRQDMRYERGVMVSSQQYNLKGRLDLLEIEKGKPPTFFPIEYKRGKPKVEEWDRIQLCAQALCIEEMQHVSVLEGAIWYWEVRRRQPVSINAEIRKLTVKTIERAQELLESGTTPSPILDKKRCRACSLRDLCAPDAFRQDRSSEYISELLDP